MTITNVSGPNGWGLYKVCGDEGEVFFVRPDYLPTILIDDITENADFTGERLDELLDVALACAAELKAVDYLSRAEQCRFGLWRKLTEKKFDKAAIEKALDFLEKGNYLCDGRFARAWLNSRRINHYEGRARLKAELLTRGISGEVSENALDEFFLENDERELCQKAVKKLKKSGKTDEKLVSALLKAGFSYKLIKDVLLESESDFESE